MIGNSVSSAFENAFSVKPIVSTAILVLLAAVIVLRKHATARVLDVIVPVMAGLYFALTIFVILRNIGAVVMNGVKRGLFSNEAGSGSAPCAAAAADTDHPAKIGLFQAMGVFIDTIVICSCTAFIMLLVPEEQIVNLQGMDILQTAMAYHFGPFGKIFIAIILWLFSFSTFLGILFYARANISYIFGDNWVSQTGYKIFALIMLFVGGLAQYTVVWDMGDMGVGLMTIFNLLVMYPLSKEALNALKDYEERLKLERQENK